MLSRYESFERVGSGGMGVVYRAVDATLKRPVALKFLTASSFGREEMRVRFLREARTAAALNHPNVCTVYEVAEVAAGEEGALGTGHRLDAGTPYIAMELVEGTTLAELLRDRGPQPLEDLLRIAVRVAEGLAAAHGQGIVHRDLKPGNVMVAADGRVKILDFGLAKPLEAAAGDDVMSAAETISAELTQLGRVLGTVAYMSPEQAMGRAVDSRSDVFSFGIVLYEMAAGRRPFRGESTTSTLAKIIEGEPETLSAARADLPPELLRIVRRCLRKNPDERYNDTRDLVVALKDLRQETTSGAVRASGASSAATGAGVSAAPAAGVPSPARGRRALGWGVAAAAIVALAAVAGWYGLRPAAPATQAAVAAQHKQLTFTGSAGQPAVSPDGRSVAYLTEHGEDGVGVSIQDVSGGQPLEVYRADAIWAFAWKPDGSSLLVSGERGDSAKTELVPRLGGVSRSLPLSAPMFDWSPDGERIVASFYSARNVFIIDLDAPEPTSVAIDAEYRWEQGVAWSPRGDRLLFHGFDDAGADVLVTLTVDGAQQREILREEARIESPRWAPAGDAVYFLAGRAESKSLMKLRVDPATGEARGEPRTLLAGLRAAGFSISADGGLLAYELADERANLWMLDVDLERGAAIAAQEKLTTGTLLHEWPRFSPDGASLAYVARGDAYVMTLADRSSRQLTFTEREEWAPVWSPDGRTIALGGEDEGGRRVFRVGASGGVPRPIEEITLSSELAWAPGTSILCQSAGNRNFLVWNPSTKQATPLVDDESVGWIFHPAVSPDGTRVAVMWNRGWESGGERRFGPGLWLVPLDGGEATLLREGYLTPVGWTPDGRHVVATSQERELVRVPLAGGAPDRVVPLPFDELGTADLSPDGRRLVVAVPESDSDVWLIEGFDAEAQ